MHLSEFNKLNGYLRAGDSVAVKFKVKVTLKNQYCKSLTRTEMVERQEILKFVKVEGLDVVLKDPGSNERVRVLHVNLNYLKKIPVNSLKKQYKSCTQ